MVAGRGSLTPIRRNLAGEDPDLPDARASLADCGHGSRGQFVWSRDGLGIEPILPRFFNRNRNAR
jgi:hypothetical protein